jgi:hypothetical protein
MILPSQARDKHRENSPKKRRFLFLQEGPNECDVVLLKDQKTLWAVMRVDGGDGTPSHRTLPFLASTSTDSGVSWTPAAPLPVRTARLDV